MRSGPAVPVTSNRLVPVGSVAFATALYAVLYLVWEQSGWGSPTVRDIVGNVAFMPINLTVLTLFALGLEAGNPGSGRAPRPSPARARRGDGVHRQRHLHRVRPDAPRQPAGVLGRPVLPDRLAAHAHRAPLVPAGAPHPIGAVEVPARRRDGAGGRRGRDLVLLGPPDRRLAGEQPRRHPAGVRLSAGEHAGPARRHHGAAPPAGRWQPVGLPPRW